MEENIFYNFKKGNALSFFKTDYFNYPAGENLGFNIANSLHLYMCIPLKFFFGVIESYNALVIIIFLLNFLMAYLLANYLFSSKPTAFCSALVFTLNSYVLLKMNLGFVQKCTLFWIPLYCLFLFKLQNTKSWRYAFGASFILTLIQLTYPPYACFTAIFTVLLSSYSFLKREELWFAFSRFVFILILHIVLTSSIYYLMGFGFVYFKLYEPNLNINLGGCLDLFRPFRFYPYHSFDYPTNLALGISFSAFSLGLVALFKKRGLPRLIFFNFVFLVILSAGSYLTYDGEPVRILGHKVILPLYLITKYLPFFGKIFFSIRVFPFINICLAILAGYGLIYFFSIEKRIKPIVIAVIFLFIYLLENLILFPQLFPPKISYVNIPKFYQKIKEENFDTILHLPVCSDVRIHNRYGYYTVLSGKKMVNSYWNDNLPIYLPKDSDNTETKRKFIEQLSRWDVRYIIIHQDILRAGKSVSEANDEFGWLQVFCQDALSYPKDNLLVYKIPR